MNLEELKSDVCQLKKDVLKMGVDLVWIKRIGLFTAIAITGQLIIKIFS